MRIVFFQTCTNDLHPKDDFVPTQHERDCLENQTTSIPPIPNIVHFIYGLNLSVCWCVQDNYKRTKQAQRAAYSSNLAQLLIEKE